MHSGITRLYLTFSIRSAVSSSRMSVAENDKNLPRDCVLFLANALKLESHEVRKEMSRHAYWLNIPIADMKQTIEMLKHEGFALKDIAANIHIVLYSG